jgi:O-methyltransferase
MLKRLFYLLPDFITSIITRFSYRFYNNESEDFINNDKYGKYFNITRSQRIYILKRLKFSFSRINSATSLEVQLKLIKEILKLKKKNACIVECGCFKGSSSVALSIACKLIGARLIIYDSFEGLPSSEKKIGLREYPHLNLYGYYNKGMYKSTKEEVIRNLNLYGELSVCELRKGYFINTLKKHKEDIDFCFLDVDLTESTKDCIKYLWKKLRDNSYIYTDDACDLKVVKIWFDHKWWNKVLNENPPGYVGSGCGLPINNDYSSLGYAYKNKFKRVKNLKKYKWLKSK